MTSRFEGNSFHMLAHEFGKFREWLIIKSVCGVGFVELDELNDSSNACVVVLILNSAAIGIQCLKLGEVSITYSNNCNLTRTTWELYNDFSSLIHICDGPGNQQKNEMVDELFLVDHTLDISQDRWEKSWFSGLKFANIAFVICDQIIQANAFWLIRISIKR